MICFPIQEDELLGVWEKQPGNCIRNPDYYVILVSAAVDTLFSNICALLGNAKI